MSKPKGGTPKPFHRTLSNDVSMDDHEWRFAVPDLPPTGELNQKQLVKTISLKTESRKHRIMLRFETLQENRAIRGEPLDKFILISFAEFRCLHRENEAVGMTSRVLQPTTPKECTDYKIELLRAGVWLNDIQYNFYGHSNSQLKSGTCFLFAAPKDVIAKKIEALGDFSKMKTVAKKAKRIGLLFSVARVACSIEPDRCEDIPDIETDDYVFTDGCGLIAPRLARELARRDKIVFRNRRYTPSVYQLRYRGYKGVVTLDPRMKDDSQTLLKLRKSMKKFSGGDDYSFSVVDYSKV
jgi:hypothetical protein